jgi:hypothetical protein
MGEFPKCIQAEQLTLFVGWLLNMTGRKIFKGKSFEGGG